MYEIVKSVNFKHYNDYIISIKMMDLYLVIVPFLSLIAILNILVLKFAIKDNTVMSKILSRKKQNRHHQHQKTEHSNTKNNLRFILLNFTPLEFCAVRRARFKVSFFLAVSTIITATYFVASPFAFIGIGTIVYFLYFLSIMRVTRSEPEGDQEYQCKKYRQKYIQIACTVISLVLNFCIISSVFKSYKNSQLKTFLGNVGLNLVLDSFLVRPTLSILISLPLSLSQKFTAFVHECQQQIVLLETYETVGQKKIFQNPGKNISPSKIPQSIPLQFEIEPRPYSQQSREDEAGKEKVMDLLKKIKKEHFLPPLPSALNRSIEGQASLDSLFNSSKKDQHSVIAEQPILEQPEEKAQSPKDSQEVIQELTINHMPPKHSERVLQELTGNHMPAIIKDDDAGQSLTRRKKIFSENLILIAPSRPEQAQNQQDIVKVQEEAVNDKKDTDHEQAEQNDQIDTLEPFKKKENHLYATDQPLKITINSSEQPSSRQEPLRICINDEINLEHQEEKSDEEDIDNFKKRKEMLTIQESKGKSLPFGVLQINEKHHQSSEIQQIDLNSPQRKRRGQLHVQLQQQSKVSMLHKKKKKKLSHDHHNRVIKFSTGEPYLEYLPNMLAKDKNKKSQGFNRKDTSYLDSRLTSSVKKPNKNKIKYGQNNQNIVPEFKIEQL